MRRDEAMTILAQHQEALRARRVRSLAIFGSVARDEARPDSDIDVLVELERPAGLFELAEVQRYLEGLFATPVDLVTPDGIKHRLRERTLGEAIRAVSS